MCVTKPAVAKYWLRADRFRELTAAKGWDNDHKRGKAIGLAHTTIARLCEDMPAGLRSIDLITAALDVEVDELFERRAA